MNQRKYRSDLKNFTLMLQNLSPYISFTFYLPKTMVKYYFKTYLVLQKWYFVDTGHPWLHDAYKTRNVLHDKGYEGFIVTINQ